jgi:hypothetical protein
MRNEKRDYGKRVVPSPFIPSTVSTSIPVHPQNAISSDQSSHVRLTPFQPTVPTPTKTVNISWSTVNNTPFPLIAFLPMHTTTSPTNSTPNRTHSATSPFSETTSTPIPLSSHDASFDKNPALNFSTDTSFIQFRVLAHNKTILTTKEPSSSTQPTMWNEDSIDNSSSSVAQIIEVASISLPPPSPTQFIPSLSEEEASTFYLPPYTRLTPYHFHLKTDSH